MAEPFDFGGQAAVMFCSGEVRKLRREMASLLRSRGFPILQYELDLFKSSR